MSKKDMLKTLDTSSYFSLIAGAILVLFFEIFASLIILRLSVILFGSAFLMFCVLCAMKLVFMKNETKENDELLVDKTKENKPWLITRLVLSGLGFALMIVFLCFF